MLHFQPFRALYKHLKSSGSPLASGRETDADSIDGKLYFAGFLQLTLSYFSANPLGEAKVVSQDRLT